MQNRSDIRAAVEQIGFPVIIKPIAGAGSADTYRVNDRIELERTVLRKHVKELSVKSL